MFCTVCHNSRASHNRIGCYMYTRRTAAVRLSLSPSFSPSFSLSFFSPLKCPVHSTSTYHDTQRYSTIRLYPAPPHPHPTPSSHPHNKHLLRGITHRTLAGRRYPGPVQVALRFKPLHDAPLMERVRTSERRGLTTNTDIVEADTTHVLWRTCHHVVPGTRRPYTRIRSRTATTAAAGPR